MKMDLVSDNEAFVRMIEIARSDTEFRNMLLQIIGMDNANRRFLINMTIDSMKAAGEKKELIDAFGYLMDDGIVKKLKAELG
ncbi:MAG TPA: hypothetical protein PK573_00880 [Spirochaetota bacterium]|nr:hypothetical protein [Spirochaetota bacterium]HRZ26047.1 hypothetical protein [Spirochaetota bacterium]HSA16341.1 hypothetical protein [Spirochaetota bacterium]